jgi:competence protein ComGF
VIRPEIGISKFISIEILFALVIVIVTLHKIIVGLLLIIWDKDHRTHAGINLMILLAGMY